MKKFLIAALIITSGVLATEVKGEEVVKSVRVNIGGGFFDEGYYDEDTGNISGEFEIGLKNGNITNSLGLGINYYDWDHTDADPTTLEVYYSPRYTFDNNWYVSGRLGYSVGDADDNWGAFKEEIDMTGFVFGIETGYTFDNNLSVHFGYKAVETEVTQKISGQTWYEEDGYTHLGYLGLGYSF